MSPQYQLPINDTLKTAWQLTNGAKGTIWAALGVLFLCWIGIYLLETILVIFPPALLFIIAMIAQMLLFLMQTGLFYLGIHRAFSLPIRYSVIFDTLNAGIAWKIIGLFLLQMIILFLPVVLMVAIFYLLTTLHLFTPMSSTIVYALGVIFSIYLFVKIFLGTAYVLDKKVNPWQAIKLSFVATKGNILPLIVIYLMQMIIFIISAIPLGIGLIWTIPFMIILYGVIYRRLTTRVD